MTLDLAALAPALAGFWTERHLCTLTTLRADGTPHVTPVGVALDPEQGCAWVITSRGSHKARHVADSSRVAACQVDGRRWSTLEGVAEVRDDPEAVARAVERYARRYRAPRVNPERVAIRILPTRLLASAALR
jgi:PPOX class probable F420-dependent enzyme